MTCQPTNPISDEERDEEIRDITAETSSETECHDTGRKQGVRPSSGLNSWEKPLSIRKVWSLSGIRPASDGDGHGLKPLQVNCMTKLSVTLASGENISNLDASVEPERLEAQHPKDDLLTTELFPAMIHQPNSRPISNGQLAAEAKGIYAGLVIVETKCINIDRNQLSEQGRQSNLTKEQWQALTALHRTLLYEHHDFLLASQHPSASPALNRLADEYTMPFRMWKHAIHAFLEVLRHHLPESLDHMLNFFYLAYQMMALLYETVPLFEDTWLECLGDLDRYRMAIKTDDVLDQDVWAGIARYWFAKASDRKPTVGRLYHHLALLKTSSSLQQLHFFCKSLTCVQPFTDARGSNMAFFEPLLANPPQSPSHVHANDVAFVRIHSLMYAKVDSPGLPAVLNEYCSRLDSHVEHTNSKWKEQGAFAAVANVSAWFGYGSERNALRALYDNDAMIQRNSGDLDPTAPRLAVPINATNLILAVNLRRHRDRNVLPHVYIVLAFYYSLYMFDNVNTNIRTMLRAAPWLELSSFLNALSRPEPINDRVQRAGHQRSIFRPEKGLTPLPEDYLIRGLIWSLSFFNQDWFSGKSMRRVDCQSFQALAICGRREYPGWVYAYRRWFLCNMTTRNDVFPHKQLRQSRQFEPC